MSTRTDRRNGATESDAEVFDRIALRRMKMTGQEFLRRWDRGDYRNRDWDEVDGLVSVAMAIPLVRQVPGATVQEAVESYLEPLRAAVRCLHTGASIQARGNKELGQSLYWSLNDGQGLDLAPDGHFEAEQRYEIIEFNKRPRSQRFRVTTRMYAYEMTRAGEKLWQIHWHPDGEHSNERRPHIHLPGLAKAHLPTWRLTLENAVEWCIQMGAVPTCEDWETRLDLAEAPHIEHRTWNRSLDRLLGRTSK